MPQRCAAYVRRQSAACPARAQAHARRHARRLPLCLAWRIQLTLFVTQVVIALGSNQGDRAALLRAASRSLRSAGVDVSAFSSLYETAPAYVTDQARRALCLAAEPSAESRYRSHPQPPFLNAAVRGTTHLPPHKLLRQLKAIEAELGRTGGGQVRPAARAVGASSQP